MYFYLCFSDQSLKLGDGLKTNQILLIFLLWTGAIMSALQTYTAGLTGSGRARSLSNETRRLLEQISAGRLITTFCQRGGSLCHLGGSPRVQKKDILGLGCRSSTPLGASSLLIPRIRLLADSQVGWKYLHRYQELCSF